MAFSIITCFSFSFVISFSVSWRNWKKKNNCFFLFFITILFATAMLPAAYFPASCPVPLLLYTKYLSDNIKLFILAGIPASQQFRLIVYNTTVVWIYTSVLQTKICFIGIIWILGKLLVQVHSCKFYNFTSDKINFYTFRFLLPALQALPSAWLWNTVVNLWSTVIYFGVL